MIPQELYKPFIILKQEKITSFDQITPFQYFIVHAVSQTRIYNRQQFLTQYSNFDDIIDLYCINPHEELRYNNHNWVRLYETDQVSLPESSPDEYLAIKTVNRVTKEFNPISEEKGISFPLIVYKYFYFEEPLSIVSKEENREIIDTNHIRVLYRHSIKNYDFPGSLS